MLVVTDTGILYPLHDPVQERLIFPDEEAEESRSANGQILLGVILMVMGIGVSAVIWNMHRLDAKIVESGVAVEAEVVKVGHLRPKKNENCCLVYRLTLPDGRVIERTWHDEDGRWKNYRPGDRILIRYHPDDPERHLIEYPVETASSNTLRFIAIIGLIFLGLGVTSVVSGMRHAKRKA